MPRDPNHWSSDELRQRFEAFSARFAEKGRPGPAGASAAPPADDYWKSLQDLFTRDVTARDFQDLVRRDGEDTWRFFTREIDFSGLERKPWYRRYPAGMWKVFLALAFRLSPARRVIFATSVLLLVGAWVKFILTHAEMSGWGLLSIQGSLVAATLLFVLLLVALRVKLALK